MTETLTQKQRVTVEALEGAPPGRRPAERLREGKGARAAAGVRHCRRVASARCSAENVLLPDLRVELSGFTTGEFGYEAGLGNFEWLTGKEPAIACK